MVILQTKTARSSFLFKVIKDDEEEEQNRI